MTSLSSYLPSEDVPWTSENDLLLLLCLYKRIACTAELCERWGFVDGWSNWNNADRRAGEMVSYQGRDNERAGSLNILV